MRTCRSRSGSDQGGAFSAAASTGRRRREARPVGVRSAPARLDLRDIRRLAGARLPRSCAGPAGEGGLGEARRGIRNGVGLDGAVGKRVGAATSKRLAAATRLSTAGGRHLAGRPRSRRHPLIAAGDREHSGAQYRREGVDRLRRFAPVPHAACQPPGQAEPAFASRNSTSPPSEKSRPPSNSAVTFLRWAAGKPKGRMLSSVMAGAALSFSREKDAWTTNVYSITITYAMSAITTSGHNK